MRAGGCAVQQALTPEAASVVKQAVALARRRGHAQVTPLHVANTMLAASTGLLRTACLQSHTHPLQCRALELCFNVALNRLPTSTGSPMLGAHVSPCPSISNALVAAFKRAQAHQRRGSVESQQQPILAVKIELEQLIISILDDPSVSRVMREAGFSSTQVKSNVEQAVSLEICSKTTANGKPKEATNNSLPLSQTPQFQTKVNKLLTPVRNEDVMYVIDNLVDKRRRNFVIVGECLATIDGVVRAVVGKVDKRDVPEALKDVKFITLSFSSFGQPSRAEVDKKLEELKTLVRSCVGKGVILNLGDLNWVVEHRARSSGDHHQLGRAYDYCAMEHMIMEIGKLACGLMGENGRFWLMGIATFQTYMRCKSGHPSLESVWCLNTLTIPAGSLRLSLIADSEVENDVVAVKKAENGPRWLLVEDGDSQPQSQLTCCADCSAKFETEARSLQCSSSSNITTTLPAWLQQYKNENAELRNSNDTDSESINELRMKWNSICESIHGRPSPSSEKALAFSSLSPSSSFPCFSYEFQRSNTLHQTNRDGPAIESNKYCHILMPEASNIVPADQPNFRLFIPGQENDPKSVPFASNPNSTVNSAASSSDVMEMEYVSRFKEMNAENLTTLCDALEKKVPWQKDIIPEIARTILKSRSGMTRRKQVLKENENLKQETWLFFEGADVGAKEKTARELAKLAFGSQNSFVSICLSSFSSSTRADSTEDVRNKRSRDEQSWSYIERFSEAVSCNPHRVFFVEDVEQADYFSQMGFKRAIEKGRVRSPSGEEASLGDAIVILSCESFSSRSRACSPPVKQKSDGSDNPEERNETSPCVSLDLNLSLDDDISEEQSIDDIGLLEAVDGRIHFRIHHQEE